MQALHHENDASFQLIAHHRNPDVRRTPVGQGGQVLRGFWRTARLVVVAPAAFAVGLLVPTSGFSDAVSIGNPSFEEPALQGGNITSIGSPMKWDPGQSAAVPGWGGVLGFSQTGNATAVAGIRPSTNGPNAPLCGA